MPRKVSHVTEADHAIVTAAIAEAELHTGRQPPMHDVPQTLHLVEQGLYVLNGFRVPVQREGFNALLLRGLQQCGIPLPKILRLVECRHLDGEAATVDGSTGLK